MPYTPFDLTGKVALITGGNGGIGIGMADALAQAGADVVIWGNNPTKNASAEARLAAHVSTHGTQNGWLHPFRSATSSRANSPSQSLHRARASPASPPLAPLAAEKGVGPAPPARTASSSSLSAVVARPWPHQHPRWTSTGGTGPGAGVVVSPSNDDAALRRLNGPLTLDAPAVDALGG